MLALDILAASALEGYSQHGQDSFLGVAVLQAIKRHIILLFRIIFAIGLAYGISRHRQISFFNCQGSMFDFRFVVAVQLCLGRVYIDWICTNVLGTACGSFSVASGRSHEHRATC